MFISITRLLNNTTLNAGLYIYTWDFLILEKKTLFLEEKKYAQNKTNKKVRGVLITMKLTCHFMQLLGSRWVTDQKSSRNTIRHIRLELLPNMPKVIKSSMCYVQHIM